MATLGPRTAAPSIHFEEVLEELLLLNLADRLQYTQWVCGNDPSARLPPSVLLCLICLLPIGLYDDHLMCTIQCRKFHRRCFEAWSGKPYLCKGLL
jgi:hypothetical protein